MAKAHMAQLLVLYNTPAEPAAFDRYYHETHIPIAKKIPGLRSYRISSGPVQALAGNAPHLVAILDFDSMADLSRLLHPLMARRPQQMCSTSLQEASFKWLYRKRPALQTANCHRDSSAGSLPIQH